MRRWIDVCIRVVAVSAVLVLTATCLHSQGARNSKASNLESEFQKAMAVKDRGDLAQAEAILTRLHSAHPGIFALDETLGMLIALRGDYSAARPFLEAAARENPSSDVAHANLGAALYNLHRNQEAITEFRRSAKLNPTNGKVWQSLGRLYIDEHKPEEAATALLAALRLEPQNSDLQLDTIEVLLSAGRLSEAQMMLSSVTNVESSARAQILLGEADEIRKDYQSAARHFARATELEPSEDTVWQFGLDLLRHWMFNAAVIEFKAASAKFPNSKRMKLGLGAALFGAEKHEEAVPIFADLLETDTNNAVFAELLGISCNAMMQNVSLRCEELASYALEHPKDAKAATYAASSIITRNDAQKMDLAHRLLANAVVADPSYSEAQLQMGILLQETQDWQESIPYLERALKLAPANPTGHYRLARAYLKVGRGVEGKAEMELQKKYAHQANEERDKRYRDVTLLALELQP